MNVQADLVHRLPKVVLLFVVLRCGELLFVTIVGPASLYALDQVRDGGPTRPLNWNEFRGAWSVIWTYYLLFGYLYFSAFVFFMLEGTIGITSKKKLMISNLGAYLVYTLAWMFLLPSSELDGWIIFVEGALINWVMPALMWPSIAKRLYLLS